MNELIKFATSLLPVLVFLTLLVFLDSYKLIKLRAILQTIFMGCIVALVCMFVNSQLLEVLELNFRLYSRHIAPIIEESLKVIYFIVLLRTKKVGFVVDAAIYGFAIGAGFALVENVYFLQSLKDANILLWIVRGFGTAIMHGATTCIMAIVSMTLVRRKASEKWYLFLPGLIAATIVHSFFNHFLLPPIITTVSQLIALPVLIIIVFAQSENALRDWLEVGLETDVALLEYITTGTIKRTKVGEYLYSLKSRFPGEVVADMLCYLQIQLELAIRAKGILLMREVGFGIPSDPEIRGKFAELRFLEKSIGKTGKLAVSPILHTSSPDLWQLCLLDKK